MLTESVLGVGKTCKAYGNYGGGGSGYGSSGMEVLIPFKVATTGNHSLASSWTVKLASVKSFTYGGCPAKNVNYFPPYGQNSYGQCYDSASISWSASSWVTDVSNSSWYSYNYSSGYAYNNSYFDNYTSCYNYGTPSCYNSSYGSNYSYIYPYNAPGFTTFTWNGATSFTFWNNATNMKKTDSYALVFDVYLYVDGSASGTHLLTPWAVTAGGSINMATLGNGATLNSVSIV
jgi:hypothetical protein